MDCVRCKGNARSEHSCGRQFCPILQKFSASFPKATALTFSGSSPPDIFVGQFNYPNVYAGILAPACHDENANRLSAPEDWFKERMSIDNILQGRGSMIYSRFASSIRNARGHLMETMQEVSMAKKPFDIEFHLAKKPVASIEMSSRIAPIGNPAPLIRARIQENPKVDNNVEKAVSDIDLNAVEAIRCLHRRELSVTSMIKLLSAGLLGVKAQRRLVPSRWATTAVDDIISKGIVEEIKHNPWIDECLVYHEEYIGNHYEIILIPKQWSFEVIEAKMPASCWNQHESTFFACDDEGYYGRKSYASNVTGAYYSCRLAAAEHLRAIRRQASVLVLREVSSDYYAPCGVGILRETARAAFQKQPERFATLDEALKCSGARLKLGIDAFASNSRLLRSHRQQKTLFDFS